MVVFGRGKREADMASLKHVIHRHKQGHKRPVMAVSFSPDGRLIASFSLEDNQVQIWQPTSGFLGTLASAFGGSADAGLGTVGGGQMKSFRTFHAGPPESELALASCFLMFAHD